MTERAEDHDAMQDAWAEDECPECGAWLIGLQECACQAQCIGTACLVPDPLHSRRECYTAEDVENYEEEEG